MRLASVMLRPADEALEAAARGTAALLSIGVLVGLVALCVFFLLRRSQSRKASPA